MESITELFLSAVGNCRVGKWGWGGGRREGGYSALQQASAARVGNWGRGGGAELFKHLL